MIAISESKEFHAEAATRNAEAAENSKGNLLCGLGVPLRGTCDDCKVRIIGKIGVLA